MENYCLGLGETEVVDKGIKVLSSLLNPSKYLSHIFHDLSFGFNTTHV